MNGCCLTPCWVTLPSSRTALASRLLGRCLLQFSTSGRRPGQRAFQIMLPAPGGRNRGTSCWRAMGVPGISSNRMAQSIEVLYTVDATLEAVNKRAAQYFTDGIRAAAAARGKARIAISGGNTPKHTFELLAEAPYRDQIPWDKLEIY